jgi:hypothetical protein
MPSVIMFLVLYPVPVTMSPNSCDKVHLFLIVFVIIFIGCFYYCTWFYVCASGSCYVILMLHLVSPIIFWCQFFSDVVPVPVIMFLVLNLVL